MYLFFVKAAFISEYLHDPVCKYKFRYLQKKQTPWLNSATCGQKPWKAWQI